MNERLISSRVEHIDVGDTYRGVRERLTELLTPLSLDAWEQRVPHCPAWTVRQTLSHLVGVVDDAVHGNLAGAGTDEWTEQQVAKRAQTTGDQLLSDWNTYAPLMEHRLSAVGLPLAQAIFDVVTHEHDLRHALHSPGARDSDAVWVGIHFVQQRIAAQANIEMILDDILVPAQSTAVLQLRATAFDALRSFASRRTETEVRSMNWSSDPSLVLQLFPFALPTTDLAE